MSAYGGVVVLSTRVDLELAEALAEQFIEVLFAPGYDEDALEMLSRAAQHAACSRRATARGTGGRARDPPGRRRAARAGSRRRRRAARGDDGRERARAERGRVGGPAVRLARLQARALERDRDRARRRDGGDRRRADEPRGRGRLAVEKARAERSPGAVLASDAFFPFADGPELAIEAGVARDHPARRLGARRRGDRGRRCGGRRDGGDRVAATSATSKCPAPGGACARNRW